MERLSTGIAGFDRMVGGGLPAGASVVLQGPPGQEKLAVALAFLADGLRSGGCGLVVVASQSPESLVTDLRNLGVDMDLVAREKRLRIVDWYSWGEETVTDVEERGIIVRASVDLTNAGVAVSHAIAALPESGSKRAVVEMLSPAMNVYEVTQVYAFAQSTKRKFDRFHFTSLFLLEKEMHSASALSTLHQPFDGVVEIERTRIGDRIVRKIGVLHLKDTAARSDFVLLELTDTGIRVGAEPPSLPAPPADHDRIEASPDVLRAAAGPVIEPPEAKGPDPRRERIRLIMEIARARLNLEPEDRDALLAFAAAQATLDNPRGAVLTLERLEAVDPDYPGLWGLEMKLFARLGDAEHWKRARQRALAATGDATDLPASTCPFCKGLVTADAAQCPHCMAELGEEAGLLEGLQELVRATVQEMVQEELGAKPPASTPTKPLRPQPRGPSASGRSLSRAETGGRAKGLTNGLVLQRRPIRPVKATRGGRTNGLTNGLRGRTNGLTNGLGHTNGLTNGLRGRTNGLTNGLGRTNGLTNGLANSARSRGFLGRRTAPRWQRILFPVTLGALLILLPLVFLWSLPTPAYPIRIDGQFGDWASVAKVPTGTPLGLNPDIDLTRVAVTDNLDYLSFYLEVRGSALAGEPAGGRQTNAFFAFVDVDRSRATGYHVQGLGADRLLTVYTWGNAVVSATIRSFDASRGVIDWSGWITSSAIPAAGSGNGLEFQAPWSILAEPHGPVEVAFASRSWDGQSDAGDVSVTDASPAVLVSQATSAPSVALGSATTLATFTFHALGGEISVRSLNVTFPGTYRPGSIASVDLVDTVGATIASQPIGRTVAFVLPPFTIPKDADRNLSVRPRVASADGTTVGAFLKELQDVAVQAGGVAFAGPLTGPASLAYVGVSPSGPSVDAAFGEWRNATADPVGDVQPAWDRDVDLSAHAFQGSGGDTYFMARTVGTALNGTMVPALNPFYSPPANGTGNGTVSTPQPVNGTDLLRLYLDADGNASTGFSIGEIGADFMVEITGKEGIVLASNAMRFTGGNPWTWNWTQLGTAPAAKDMSRIEAELPGVAATNASRGFFQVTGWNRARDDSSGGSLPLSVLTVSSLRTVGAPATLRTLPASHGPGTVRAQDIAGNQRWFFTSSASNGTGCTNNLAASTTAGTNAASTDLTATSAICWFTPVGQPASIPAGTWEFYLDVAAKVNGSVSLSPSANGALNQWTSGGRSNCLNTQWQCVKDNPNDGDQTYISSTSASVLDSLFLPTSWPSPPTPLTILNVTLQASCKYVGGSGDVRLLVRVGSTSYAGGSHPACPSGAYTTVSYAWPTNPSSGGAWYASDISNLQIGVRDNDAGTNEVRVSNLLLTVNFKPVYSVEIDLCTTSDCATPTVLYGPTNANTFGSDILQTASLAAQSLTSGQRIRFRVAVVAGGTVTVSYNGVDPGTADSRATIPIPEFQDVVIPITSTIVLVAVFQRRRRAGRADSHVTASS